MAYPRTIRNYNAFIDGRTYFGRCKMAKLPALKVITAPHRGSGMDAPIDIDMGMEGMKAELSFAEWAPELITMFGTRVPIVLRPGEMGEEDFQATGFTATLRGRITVIDPGSLEGGTESPLLLTQSVDYYRLQREDVQLFEIDVENGKRVIGPVDQLADLRRAMGV